MSLVTIIGFIGAFTNTFMLLPQGWNTWTHRRNYVSLSGMSALTFGIIAFQGTTWIVYAIMVRDMWLGIPPCINVPLSLYTAFVVSRARRRVGTDACALCIAGIEHEVAVLEDSQRDSLIEGSRVACSPVARKHGVAVLVQNEVQAAT